MQFEKADDVAKIAQTLVKTLELEHLDIKRIFFFRSYGSKSRSYARIWSFPRILQLALNKSPHYVIEVLSHYFDKLSEKEKQKVLIHELLHIPKNFSGSLLPHKSRGRRLSKKVEELVKKL